jgi:hypothetical protein
MDTPATGEDRCNLGGGGVLANPQVHRSEGRRGAWGGHGRHLPLVLACHRQESGTLEGGRTDTG